MPTLLPFDGLLYAQAVVGDPATVTAPPYDVILAEDLHRYHGASPHNISLVDLSASEGSQDKYTRAGSLLRGWRSGGALVPTGRPSLYPYEMTFLYRGAERRVRGLIAEVALEEWGAGILPHERTMPGPIEDRLALMRATSMNLSPIYAVADGKEGDVSEMLDRVTAGPPAREVVDEEGVRHRLWIAPDPAPIDVGTLLIADGHHRYQTALAYAEERRATDGAGPWDAVMMLVVEAAEDPPILPIHRVIEVDPVPELPGQRVHDLGEVLGWLTEDDLRYGAAVAGERGVVHLIGRLEGSPPSVRALHETLIGPMPGVREVRFVHDAVAAEDAVREGRAQVALFLPPAHVDNVHAATMDGARLPQKSTYFWPKPRTGLVLRSFDQPVE